MAVWGLWGFWEFAVIGFRLFEMSTVTYEQPGHEQVLADMANSDLFCVLLQNM